MSVHTQCAWAWYWLSKTFYYNMKKDVGLLWFKKRTKTRVSSLCHKNNNKSLKTDKLYTAILIVCSESEQRIQYGRDCSHIFETVVVVFVTE